jgi:glycosyltransferase involved in cell wall biosynthesis
MRPVLFATGHVPAYRVGAFARLHERERIELALFGGNSMHGGPPRPRELPFPHRDVGAGELQRLAASGEYRAVVCPTGGRLALLAAWAGARRGRAPIVLWASLWAHPRSAAHTLSYLPLRRLYRSAQAVVTYGRHVSEYVRERGASNVFIAPQAVDNDFWSGEPTAPPHSSRWPSATTKFLFAGRPAREKGAQLLLDAWRRSGLKPPHAALVLVGDGLPAAGGEDGAVSLASVDALEMRNLYAAADALVIPSVATATFREPWGLVANEAMNRGLPVLASDAVGAAAGGLVRDGVNGVVFPAGDRGALAAALSELAGDRDLRARLGAVGRADVQAFNYDAWAAGFTSAFASLGLSEGVGSVD